LIAQLSVRTSIPCEVLEAQDPKWTVTMVEVIRVENEQAERQARRRG
jgi:hypothetical protein